MNDNVVDFMKYVDEQQAKGYANDLIVMACVCALIDITQDINRVMYYFKSTGLNAHDIAVIIEKRMDVEGLFHFRTLLDLQAGNMTALQKAINPNGGNNDTPTICAPEVDERAKEYLNSGNTRADYYMQYTVSSLHEQV